MQVMMSQYVPFIALWCLALNTYIVFSSSNVKALENREKKRMERIIYFITAAMMIGDLDIYMLAGMNAEWVCWNLKITNYFLYLSKYLYLTSFILYIINKGDGAANVKKLLLAVSVLCGIGGMVCISLPDIKEEFYYFSGLYGIIRALVTLDILVLLIALLLEKKQYRKRTFYLYLGYVFLLMATAFVDYVVDTWYLQNLTIFFSSIIIFIDNMTQVSDQWLETKKELLISEYRASHDVMTGLWNKTSGLGQIEDCLKDMSEGDVAVLGFVDIDNFKSVNDTYGHENGDFWIREVAAALQEICEPSGIVCRYGGDEYILFLRNAENRDELTARIERFRKRVHDRAEERKQDVHCSVGLYQVKGAGRELSECITMADELLYQAKENGKDTYVIGEKARFGCSSGEDL